MYKVAFSALTLLLY